MRLLLTLLKIIAVSAPLTWLWIVWGRDAYGKLFLAMAMPIYGLLGLTEIVPHGARDRFINYLPFLILMLITPRLTLKRRVIGTAVGFAVIFVVHLVFVYVASTALESRSMAITEQGFMRIVPANALSDSVPFVLWVLIAREFVWENVGRVFSSAPTPPPPPPRAPAGSEGE
jgi:hypothetical protein